MKEIPFKKYQATIKVAENIYLSLYGEPKSHKEWAEKFNKVGAINRLIWEAISSNTPFTYLD